MNKDLGTTTSSTLSNQPTGDQRARDAVTPDYSSADGQKRLMAKSMGLPADTYLKKINITQGGDYGSDPLGDGTFRMIPSGDIVDYTERNRRLNAARSQGGAS